MSTINYPSIAMNSTIASIKFCKHKMVINGEDFRIRYELESDGAKDKSIFVACKDSGENLARFWADVGEIDDGCHNFFNYDALRITPHSDLYELINPTFLK